MATAAGVFTNTVFGFIVAYTYIALWDERPHLGGYDQAQALTYRVAGPGAAGDRGHDGRRFQEELRSGSAPVTSPSTCTGPPTSSCGGWPRDLGRAAFQLLGRGMVPMVLRRAGLPTWRCPAVPADLAAFLVSVLLGVVVSFAIRYLVGAARVLAAGRAGADPDHAGSPGMFFSGMVLPLNVFPGALGEIARVLPWAALLQVPADVLLGEHTGARVAGRGLPGGWAVALLAAGRLLQSAATRKVVVQGG